MFFNFQSGGDNGTQLADLIRERDQLREKLDTLQKTIGYKF